MTTSTVNTIIGSLITDVTAVLTTNLPLILSVVGALIALALAYKYFRRFIGGK